ncbi:MULTISPECIES: hypothetical protein [Streptomyces]|uniref:Lipoprotein n=1 Tax=Streptomyces solicathayae TaxID=3081768 RepID=A0ABZ0LZ16_9ACTN|nr:hypothetical protein [Streptomyces sp. HUAS YS2]WOX24560.1 hypothetical protein R2D22_25530 [Streptomyces sp. HUAS YS2]
MTRTTRLGRAAVALAALSLAVTGCGIQESDVVEAGGAATVGVSPEGPDRITLFFVSEDGRLVPVVRSRYNPLDDARAPQSGTGSADSGPMGAGKILAALTHGTTDAERAAGLHSRIPEAGLKGFEIAYREEDAAAWAHGGRDRRTSGGSVGGGGDGGSAGSGGTPVHTPGSTHAPSRKIWIRSELRLEGLDGAAVQQIICTAAYAEAPDSGDVEVILLGRDGELPAARCE